MSQVKLVVPKRMKSVLKCLDELMVKAAQGDREAKKILDFAKNHSSGPMKMKARL